MNDMDDFTPKKKKRRASKLGLTPPLAPVPTCKVSSKKVSVLFIKISAPLHERFKGTVTV